MTSENDIVARVKALVAAWTTQVPEQLVAAFFTQEAGICGEGMPGMAHDGEAIIAVLEQMQMASPTIAIEVKSTQILNEKAAITWLHWHTLDPAGHAGPVMRSLTIWAEQQGWRIAGDMFTTGKL